AAGLSVRVLGERDHPLRTDLYLVRDDRPRPQGYTLDEDHSRSFLKQRRQEHLVLAARPEGVYLAIPSDASIEDVHFPGAQHGHNEKLAPDPTLLDPFRSGAARRFAAAGLAAPTGLSEESVGALALITPALIRTLHERYVGASPLDGVTIESRHIRHPHNRLVTEALRQHLQSLGGPGFRVGVHRFRHEDLELFNVVGELQGEMDSLVLVTAHLDSTGAFSDAPYDPATDAAPGADDDASGMAAVLATASVAAHLASTRRP